MSENKREKEYVDWEAYDRNARRMDSERARQQVEASPRTHTYIGTYGKTRVYLWWTPFLIVMGVTLLGPFLRWLLYK